MFAAKFPGDVSKYNTKNLSPVLLERAFQNSGSTEEY